jgi:hypothetical protein
VHWTLFGRPMNSDYNKFVSEKEIFEKEME